jgi:RNA 2',3'-cyclic 3'-phosphodiesterase
VRLFVAVYPPPAAVESLAAAFPPLPPPWRVVPVPQWHLTLAFLGEVSESRIAELEQRLGRAAARSDPLRLGLAGAGAFPSARRARVLWAGVTGDRDGLVRLAERASAAARRVGVAIEDRRYRPHLTLARARVPRGADATDVVVGLAGYAGPDWPGGELVLVRSVLGSVVRHERITGWALPQRPT